MKNKNENILVCPTAQYLEWLAEEKKINSIGFVKGGRELLDSQEHIFVEALAEMEVLDDEIKFDNLLTKYFPNARKEVYLNV